MPDVLYEVCFCWPISFASELNAPFVKFLPRTNKPTDCNTIVATYLVINCMRASCLPPVLVYFSFKRGVDVTKFSTTVT